jgi:hypothetical protein
MGGKHERIAGRHIIEVIDEDGALARRSATT